MSNEHTKTLDKIEIKETIAKFAYYADHREWDALTNLFTEEVRVDYTSLAGGEPGTVPASALVANWNQSLTPLKITQHYISNHIVEFTNEQKAICRAYFHAMHEYPNSFGEDQWVLGGTYTFTLIKQNQAWNISEITMTARWASGNQNILNLANPS
ncbi:nuclear transport factor 2 family protein [Shimazuella sp. AN120528]|uniref:nuclear transport factor 2 family protein n=1 Tax=Shimazuella soli TaxID=1892854 RepID=UPI001F0D7A93|nr:nuclear transport factor 2 family protein [Shimazuella soli]MCH5586409.1 nuclear transport factor 2 family protein [Shimazuella soli]